MKNGTALCLAPLTFAGLSPVEFLDVAVKAGFSRVSMRPMPFAGVPLPCLLDDASLLRDTLKRIEELHVDVQECEAFPIRPDFHAGQYAQLLDVVAAMGGKSLVCTCMDSDFNRAGDHLAVLCDRAAEYGLHVNVEFVPAFRAGTLRDAMVLVDAVGGRAGIIVDVLHFVRSGSDLKTLGEAAGRVRVVHLCDVPPVPAPATPEGLATEMRTARLAPGRGCADLVNLLSLLSDDVLFSVEVPDDALARIMSPEARAIFYRQEAEKVLTAAGRFSDHGMPAPSC